MDLILRAPIPVLLWRLAAPNTAATVSMTLVAFADAWFVGHLGITALASLAIVFPLQTLMQMMAGGAIGGGVTSALGRAVGRNDDTHASAVAWHSIVIACSMSVFFIIVLAVFPEQLFGILGVSNDVLIGAVKFAQIAFGGATATWLLFVLSAILRGTGDTATPARAIVTCSLVQIGLSGLLTLGGGPIPALGIIGPAIALVVCHGLAALYLFLHILSSHSGVKLRATTLQWSPFNDIMKVSGIGLINSLTIVATVVVVTGYIAKYGTEALAGYGLGSRLELMLVPIVFGIGGALTAAVGINFGAGDFERARRVAWSGAGVAVLITGAIGFMAAVMPGLWLSRFTADPQAHVFGALYLGIAAPFYGLFGGGQTLYFASQGTGKMVLPVLVGVARFVIVACVGYIAATNAWDISVIFMAVSAGLLTVGVGLSLCLFTPMWRPELQGGYAD